MSIKANIRIAESAARTATETFTVNDNNLSNGKFIVSITAGAGAATVTITIDGYDAASGTWYNILTSAALAANAVTTYTVGDITAAVANVSVLDFLPENFRVVATKNNGTAVTYSIGVNLSD